MTQIPRLPYGRRLLLVSSTGGHLAELVALADLLHADPASTWVTFETSQSEQLLRGKNVQFIDYIKPRDWRAAVRAVPVMRRITARAHAEALVTTGAAIAVPAALVSRAAGLDCHYIESASRFNGPSLSGKLVGAIPGVATYTQASAWANEKWQYEVSVLDRFPGATHPRPTPAHRPAKVFVTLGTIRPYRFDALVDAVKEYCASPNYEMEWQLGSTVRHDLPGTIHDQMTPEQFEIAARGADIVVSHAGLGTTMQLLEWGIRPIIVPRTKTHDEHVDDHQLQLAANLAVRGLADVADVRSVGKSVAARQIIEGD